MTLSTKRGRDIPEGSLKLTEEEALEHQKNIVRNWPSTLDVFFLKYAPVMASAATTFSASVIINHYRRVLNADWKILLFTIFPGAIFPAYFSLVQTDIRITNNVLLMKMSCPMCEEIKFALQQFFCSLALPTIYGFGTSAAYAHVLNFHPLPDIRKYPAEHWKECWKILKTGNKKLQYLGLLQSALILLLPMMQSKELLRIMETLKTDAGNADLELLKG